MTKAEVLQLLVTEIERLIRAVQQSLHDGKEDEYLIKSLYEHQCAKKYVEMVESVE